MLSVEISTVLEARLSPRGLTDARLKARRAESRERRRVADDAAVIERRANGKTKIVQKARDPDPRRRGAEIEQDAKAASAGQA